MKHKKTILLLTAHILPVVLVLGGIWWYSASLPQYRTPKETVETLFRYLDHHDQKGVNSLLVGAALEDPIFGAGNIEEQPEAAQVAEDQESATQEAGVDGEESATQEAVAVSDGEETTEQDTAIEAHRVTGLNYASLVSCFEEKNDVLYDYEIVNKLRASGIEDLSVVYSIGNITYYDPKAIPQPYENGWNMVVFYLVKENPESVWTVAEISRVS